MERGEYGACVAQSAECVTRHYIWGALRLGFYNIKGGAAQLLGGHIRGIAHLVATPLDNPPALLNISSGVSLGYSTTIQNRQSSASKTFNASIALKVRCASIAPAVFQHEGRACRAILNISDGVKPRLDRHTQYQHRACCKITLQPHI